jgi:uridine phosphorylase
MEAAALLTLGKALDKPIVCLAHVTNTMATRTEDFEKGGETGLEEALKVCELALDAALEQAGGKEKK